MIIFVERKKKGNVMYLIDYSASEAERPTIDQIYKGIRRNFCYTKFNINDFFVSPEL